VLTHPYYQARDRYHSLTWNKPTVICQTGPQSLGGSTGIVELYDDDWDDAYKLNLNSAVYMCKSVVPHVKAAKSGKIINIPSVAGKLGDSFRMPYSSIKAAVIAFIWALARGLASDNINVNCICPGLIYTPLWERGAEELWRTVASFRELKEPKDVFLRYVRRLHTH